MPWIDAAKPLPPVLSFDSSHSATYATSIDLYFRDTIKNDLINRYVIYQFDNLDSLNQSDPKNIKEIILSANNFYHFIFDVPPSQNEIVIAATALTKTNNESALTRYIYLERNNNGWEIMDVVDNK
jgi:hypothetical protein